MADQYFRSGSYPMAIYYYELALKQERTHQIIPKLGKAYFYNKQYENAVNTLKTTKDRDWETYFYVGLSHLYMQNFNDARSNLHSALRLARPDNAVLSYYYGLSLIFSGEYEKAQDLFAERSLYPGREFWLGYLLARQQDYPRALSYLEQSIRQEGWWRIDARYLRALIRNDVDTVLDQDERLRLLKARLLVNSGEYDSALAVYSTIKNYQPFRLIGEGFIHEAKDSLVSALMKFENVIATTQETDLVAVAYLHGARIAHRLSNMVKAKSYYAKYITHTQVRDEQIYYQLGRIYFDAAQYDSALVFFTLLNDSTDDFLFYEARTYYRLNQSESALHLLSRHVNMFPGSPSGDRALMIIGNIYWERKDYKKARIAWFKLLERYPTSPYSALSLMRIGDAYREEALYREALRAYRGVKDYAPSIALLDDASLAVEETKFQLGVYPKYTDALKAFLQKYPKSSKAPIVQFKLANCLLEANETSPAIATLEKIADQGNDLADDALLLLGQAYAQIADRTNQKKSYRRLVDQYRPTTTSYLGALELANLYAGEKNYDSSLHYYSLVLDSKEYSPKALLEMGRIYRAIKKYNEAKIVLNRLNNDSPPPELLLEGNLELARALKEEGSFDEALKTLKTVEGKEVDQTLVFLLKGDIYELKQDFKSAKEAFLKASELYALNRDGAAYALQRAGDMSLAVNDRLGARSIYERALSLAQREQLRMEIKGKLERLPE